MSVDRSKISELVERYKQQRRELRRSASTFSEADTRSNFIDPFFESLGWDINNRNGLPQRLREVIRETQVSVDENTKKPDYVFKLGPERKFFTEAKRPNVDILQDSRTAFQTRRYGWSAGLLVSVLTNFENLVVYDTTTPPSISDSVRHSRMYVFSYVDYVDRTDEIAALISRDSVYSGEFDDQFSTQAQKQGAEAVDLVFLETLNEWRLTLGSNIVTSVHKISEQVLNEVVQRFILRILFLRMCEDRGIETYEHLKRIAQLNDWLAFVNLLRESDKKYDSELFAADRDPFLSSGGNAIQLNSSTVQSIIDDLYFPRASYTFSVFEPEFLGHVYEQFLVDRLVVSNSQATLQRKPENVDRDVVPTPRPIIERVVQDTLEPHIASLSVDELFSFQIIDPACGSGGFLISAFDVLTDRAIAALEEQGQSDSYYETISGKHLTFEKKRDLLINCLYGVDRDYLAVEVARFSLLVKLLENETPNSLPEAVDLLPSLESNIVYGDSLVDERIYQQDSDPDLVGVPLEWGEDIPAPQAVVVGNPPYLFTEAMKNLEPVEYEFYKEHYHLAFGQFDKYYLFIERALSVILADNGFLGMVVSRKFANIESGEKLRGLISRGRHLIRLVDFGTAQMFAGRTTYTCLLFLSQEGVKEPEEGLEDTFEYELVTTPQEWLAGMAGNYSNVMTLPRKLVEGDTAWLLPSTHEELELILALYEDTVPLGELFDIYNGIQTSKNTVYVITEWRDVNYKLIAFSKEGQEWLIERAILRPFYDDNISQLKSFHPMPDTAQVIFPYFLDLQDDGTLRASVIPSDVMKQNYPNAYRWLEHNIDSLKVRDIRPSPFPSDEWYRFGRDQALTSFENRPKIVVGVNSLGDKYVLDFSNTLLASGGTAGECAIATFREQNRQTPYDLHFILAILNHKAIEFFCRKRGSPFRGGWFARGTAVLKDVPIPIIDFDELDGDGNRIEQYNKVVGLSRELCDIYQTLEERLSGKETLKLRRRARLVKQQMDNLISELYGTSNLIDKIDLPR
jgi:hypothetical protein